MPFSKTQSSVISSMMPSTSWQLNASLKRLVRPETWMTASIRENYIIPVGKVIPKRWIDTGGRGRDTPPTSATDAGSRRKRGGLMAINKLSSADPHVIEPPDLFNPTSTQ